jgi:tRNA-specific 2-thiouridylase
VNNDSAIIYFDDPVFAAAPGQSVVLYDGEICLGGGIIEPYIN